MDGWDNRTFRLGDDLAVGLPSEAAYAAHIDKEHCWLPFLTPGLALPIPEPLALGQLSDLFPWSWSARRWLPGGPVARYDHPGASQNARARPAVCSSHKCLIEGQVTIPSARARSNGSA